jgi:hypothetical protein
MKRVNIEKEKNEEIKKLKAKKEKERQAILQNPFLKKMINKMIDEEAELGSDNEENDNVIKKIEEEDE